MTEARDLTLKLGGRWYQHYGTAPCPVCQIEGRKEQNALTLRDGMGGRLLAHCKRLGCDFRDILAAAGIASGDYRAPDPRDLLKRETSRPAEAVKRARQAERLWNEAQAIAGTPAETYLREARGVNRRAILTP